VRILLERSPGLLAPVCERLLLERQAHDRKKLLHLLGSNGSDAALRLLARAVRAAGPGVSTDALHALGRFPHPMALEVLREVVERNNRDDLDLEEVDAALHAIHDLGIKEAHSFLWEMVQSRRSLFSYAYVRPVRVLAEGVLQKGARR
jgi:HEAT repeat protein